MFIRNKEKGLTKVRLRSRFTSVEVLGGKFSHVVDSLNIKCLHVLLHMLLFGFEQCVYSAHSQPLLSNTCVCFRKLKNQERMQVKVSAT